MEIWNDEVGMHFRATLPDTEEARSVYTAVKRGDMSGVSFGFTVSDGSQYDVNTRTRTINKIDKVLEFSIVNYPAYSETSVEARNQIQVAELRHEQYKQAQINLNKLLTKEIK